MVPEPPAGIDFRNNQRTPGLPVVKAFQLFFGRLLIGADIDTFLLHRHMVIDHLLDQAIASGYTQVIELASGLSGRGYAFCGRYGALRYIETDLPI